MPAEGALLVNLGDLTARMTNDRWMSTLHRVKPPVVDGTIRRRRSVAFFHDGNADAVISTLDSLLDLGDGLAYELHHRARPRRRQVGRLAPGPQESCRRAGSGARPRLGRGAGMSRPDLHAAARRLGRPMGVGCGGAATRRGGQRRRCAGPARKGSWADGDGVTVNDMVDHALAALAGTEGPCIVVGHSGAASSPPWSRNGWWPGSPAARPGWSTSPA